MRATIEIGRAVRQFWVVASRMAHEHMRYYARHAAFAANRRFFETAVEAVNSGRLPAKYALVGGANLPPGALEELDPGLDFEVKAWGQVDSLAVSGGRAGLSRALCEGKMHVGWTTCAGNILELCLDGEWVTANVEGKRHGIPWHFFSGVIIPDDMLVIGMESCTPNSPPWCDGRGDPLIWTERDANAVPKGDEPLVGTDGEFPEWGNGHQQEGWAARRVQMDDAFSAFCHNAAILGLPSSRIEHKAAEYFGPFCLANETWCARTDGEGA